MPEPFSVNLAFEIHDYVTYKRARLRHPEISIYDWRWVLGVRRAIQLEQMFLRSY